MSMDTSQYEMRGSSVEGQQVLNPAPAYSTDMEIPVVESDQPNDGSRAGHKQSGQIRHRASRGDRPEMIQSRLQDGQALKIVRNNLGWHKC